MASAGSSPQNPNVIDDASYTSAPPFASRYTFTDLPPEIRNHIYKLLLTKRRRFIYAAIPAASASTSKSQPPTRLKKLALFLVNKQISKEAIFIFYSKSPFFLGAHNSPIRELNRFLRIVPAAHVAMIERLAIQFTFTPYLWRYRSVDYEKLVFETGGVAPWERRALFDADDGEIVKGVRMCRAAVKHFRGARQICVRLFNSNQFNTDVEKSDNALCFVKIMKILTQCEKLEDIWVRHSARGRVLPILKEILDSKEADGTILQRVILKTTIHSGQPFKLYFVEWWRKPNNVTKRDIRLIRDILDRKFDWKGVDVNSRQLVWEMA